MFSSLDDHQLKACLDTVADRINRDISEAHRVGIRATPTFFLGVKSPENEVAILRRINGAQPSEVFASAIDELQQELGKGGLR